MPDDLLEESSQTAAGGATEWVGQDTGEQADSIFALTAQWRDKPQDFVRDVLKAQPYEWQATALDTLATHDLLAIRSGHGVGKTTFLAWVIIWFLSTRTPAKVGCTAPRGEQIEQNLWPEIARWMRNMPDDLREILSWTRKRVDVVGEHESFAVSSTTRPENPIAFQGLHSEHFLLIVDEASGVSEKTYEAAESLLTTEGAKWVMTGNPNLRTGRFYRIFHDDKLMEEWQRMHVPCATVPGVSQKFIDRIASAHGVDSNQYRVRVLGEFPFDDEDTIIPSETVMSAVDRDIVIPLGQKPVWGVDIARHGNDRCALAKRHGPKLLEPVKTWRGADLMQTAGRIRLAYEETPQDLRPAWIMLDAIGLGYGVADRLKEFNLPVRAINVGESPAVREQYVHLRDELWYKGREWFGGRDVSIPNDPMLIEELISIKSKVSPAGKILVESKDEMKKRIGRSPDCADAFLLTLMRDGNRARREAKLPYKRKFL